MSDPYGRHERAQQETTAQPVVDPYPQQGQSTYYGGQQQYGQPQAYPQQGYSQNPYAQQPYGQPMPYGAPGTPYAGYRPTPTNGVALASLIVSIAGIPVFFGLSGIVAVILGIVGLKRSNQIQGIGRGQAIAGIVIGALQVVLIVGLMAALLAIMMIPNTTG